MTDAITPGREKDLIVRLEDQLVVFPGPRSRAPRCVAAGKKPGSRCDRVVEDGDYNGWSQWPVPGYGGLVSAMEPGGGPLDSFLKQRCPRHMDSTAIDVVAPEWEPFDPDRHSHLIDIDRVIWTPAGLCKNPARGVAPVAQDIAVPALTGLVEPTFAAILAQAEQDRKGRLDAQVETALYSYYDVADRSLYIGISDDLRTRTLAHLEASSWMDFAARSTIKRYATRAGAAEAEVAAIKAELPLFNRQHNDTPEARARLVAYLIEHGRADLLMPAVSRG